mgnify:CR=1 FL=1
MQYKKGDIVSGTVNGIQPYGAFIRLDNDEQGLIHISEISGFFVKNIEQYLKVGQKTKVKIIEVLEERHLYRFSLKQVEPRYRQNIRNAKASHKRNRYRIPSDKQDFTPLEENLEKWIQIELKRIGEEND